MKASQPLTSVVIPAYNSARFLTDAIESVLLQSSKPLEVIVVDDGSTDDTPIILSSFGDAIKVVTHKSNCGLPTARNSGIKMASGQLVGFLDSDDIWLPSMVERQEQEFLESPELGLCFTSLIDCDEQLENRGVPRPYRTRKCEWVFDELYLTAFPIPPSTTFVRRSVFDVVGMFDESMLMKQDYECWLRISMKYPISCIGEALCLRRWQPGSLTFSKPLRLGLEFEQRGFELCSKAAERFGVMLPLPVKERTAICQRRRFREAMGFGSLSAARTYHAALVESGNWRWMDLVLGFLVFLRRRAQSAFPRGGRPVA